MSLAIDIRTLPHDKQRYNTIGDYWKEGAVDFVRVSSLGNRVYEFLVSIHEQVESFLCEQRGISEPTIKEFDEKFEAHRAAMEKTLRLDAGEPGDHPQAPYRQEHRFAENIERQIAHELGVDWNEYEKTVDALWNSKPNVVGRMSGAVSDNSG